MNKKLEAFTIIEIAITLLISSIVVSGSMLAYRSIQNMTTKWWSFQDGSLITIQGSSQFQFDVFNSSAITYSDSAINLNMDTDTITYSMQQPFLIRNRVDTVLQNCTNWSFKFEPGSQLISSIEFEIITHNSILPVILKKQNSYYRINQYRNGDSN